MNNLLIIFISLLISSNALADVILRPIKAGEARALVLIPGAAVKAEQYEALARQIQNTFPESLWVLIPSFLGDFPNPVQMESKITTIVRSVKEIESIDRKNVFLAGHSLGGIMARQSAKKMDLGGLILFASYLPKSDIAGRDLVSNFPIPVLTLGGELDGLTSMNYIAREMMEASGAKLELSNVYEKPVILLEGINHSQFADGYGAKRDLESPLSLEQAHKRIADVTSAFILANNLSDDGAAMELAQLQDRSSYKLSAFVKAQKLEDSLCDISQNLIIGAFPVKKKRLVFNTEVEENIGSFALSKPSVAIESGQINFSLKSFNFNAFNPMDISEKAFISPDFKACKMKSRNAVDQLLGLSLDDHLVSCSDINEKLLERVMHYISEEQKGEIIDAGFEIYFKEDYNKKSGVTWLASRVKEKLDENVLNFTSTSLYTDLKANKRFAGMRYCKLMSPVRMVEWLLHERRFIK